jgi:hypothetical protein
MSSVDVVSVYSKEFSDLVHDMGFISTDEIVSVYKLGGDDYKENKTKSG